MAREIEYSQWKLPGGRILEAYTADWCGACQRVKPVLQAVTEGAELQKSETLTKKPSHVGKIPWFDLKEGGGKDYLLRSMQSSDHRFLTAFVQ